MSNKGTRREIEKQLKISRSTFFRMLKKGQIEPVTYPTPPLYQLVSKSA